MKEIKLTKALASLSKLELYRFGLFLHSNYFNKSDSNITLFNYLKEFYPHFERLDLKKEDIFKKLYPNTSFDDKKLRDRFTHLLSLLKHFLAIEKFESNSFEFKKNLISSLREKRLDNMVKEEFDSTLSTLEKLKCKDEYYFLNIFYYVY